MAEATLCPHTLARMDAAICEEFEKSARLRKIIPEVEMPDARYGVVVPKIVSSPGILRATTTNLIEPIILSYEVEIDARQSSDIDLVVELARSATRTLCRVEDRIIAYGSFAVDAALATAEAIDGVLVSGVKAPGAIPRPLTAGLFTRPTVARQVLSAQDKLALVMAEVVTKQDTAGLYQPFAAAFPPSGWREYLSLKERAARRIWASLGSEDLNPVGSSPDISNRPDPLNRAEADVCVFSCDSGRLDLARIQRPTGSLRGYSDRGRIRYFIEEMFLLRVKDEKSLVPVWREPPASGANSTTYWSP